VTSMEQVRSEILRLPGGPARVEWRRSRRAQRVSLRIDPRGGLVVVTLPPRAARTAGMALLMDHAAWVTERLAALPGHIPFRSGEKVPVHGRTHRIRHVVGPADVRLDGREIVVGGEADAVQRRVSEFLHAEARHRFADLVAEKAAVLEMRPRRVVVKDTRSRWGSCAADRTLSFSWRLVMAPRFVQDYVAAHEVAHMRHMNHGSRFWAVVEMLTPYRATAVEWLHDSGAGLLRIG
jgi:predicted metal-dependent hydrolase